MLPAGVKFTGITFDDQAGELFFTKDITFTNMNAVTITFNGPATGEMFFNIKEKATNNTDSDWWDFEFTILDKVEGALTPPFNTTHPTKAHLHPDPFDDETLKNKLKALDVPNRNGNKGVPQMTALAKNANDIVAMKGGVWTAETLRLHDIVDAGKKNMQFDFTEKPSVPEPATLSLFVMAGLLGYGFACRTRERRGRR